MFKLIWSTHVCVILTIAFISVSDSYLFDIGYKNSEGYRPAYNKHRFSPDPKIESPENEKKYASVSEFFNSFVGNFGGNEEKSSANYYEPNYTKQQYNWMQRNRKRDENKYFETRLRRYFQDQKYPGKSSSSGLDGNPPIEGEEKTRSVKGFSQRRNIMRAGDIILGAPTRPEHLPEALPILPGHTLLRPAKGMLKSAVKYPLRDFGGSAVYGNLDNLGITLGKTRNRIRYTDFRKSNNNFMKTLLKTIQSNKYSAKGRHPLIVIEIDPSEIEPIHREKEIRDVETDEILDDLDALLANDNHGRHRLDTNQPSKGTPELINLPVETQYVQLQPQNRQEKLRLQRIIQPQDFQTQLGLEETNRIIQSVELKNDIIQLDDLQAPHIRVRRSARHGRSSRSRRRPSKSNHHKKHKKNKRRGKKRKGNRRKHQKLRQQLAFKRIG